MRDAPPSGIKRVHELTEMRITMRAVHAPYERSSRRALRASQGTIGKGQGGSLPHEEGGGELGAVGDRLLGSVFALKRGAIAA